MRRRDFAVQGIDVSHYQKHINWQEVATQNISFAFVKATEGATIKDTLFDINWRDMGRVKLRRGAYHFFRPSIPTYKQVFNFINAVKLNTGDLPPVLDVEVTDNVSPTALVNRVQSWLTIAELHYGVKPIIYTNASFYNRYLVGHFNDYPLWIARYGIYEPLQHDGRRWTFWQYGNQFRVGGIKNVVDLNAFYGTEADLYELCIPTFTLSRGVKP